MERTKGINRLSKDVMPKICRDREEGWSLMGTVFLTGLSRIVFWDVYPFSVMFSTNKRESPLLCYYKEE